ncbi:unnamed protein product [Clonostachys byssicola]|uniref:F-box domain-containing protein n=1 Tax=Clonostachys byssicola TaxID=160290 RepID=A0A9N9USI4_9HYPO|nr:unnamed protein product [Clonostachys byssicola]
MAQLSTVPIEVVHNILSFVPRADLSRLCRVNKSLYQIAQLFLYSIIDINWGDDETVPSCHNPPIIPLLRTLLRKPELFSYIDKLYLSGGRMYDNPERPLLDTKDLSPNLSLFIDAIKTTQVSYTSLWIDRLIVGGMDALAGLLITSVSRIRCLHIGHNYVNGDDILGKVLLSKVYGELPAFERLKEVWYTKRKEDYAPRRNEIFPCAASLFYLPTATDFYISMSNPNIFVWPREKPNLDHLTDLSIEWILEENLVRILAITPNLKSLEYTWIYYPDDELEYRMMDLDYLVDVLSCVKETLEKFTFWMEMGDEERDGSTMNMEFRGAMRGLAEFDKLKYLDIPLVCLAGFAAEPIPLEQSIPAHVEMLHLPNKRLSEHGVQTLWLDHLWRSGQNGVLLAVMIM